MDNRITSFSKEDWMAKRVFTNNQSSYLQEQKQPQQQSFRVLKSQENESDNSRVIILSNDDQFIRVEVVNTISRGTMAANYFFITVDKSSRGSKETMDSALIQELSDAIRLQEGEDIRLERSTDMSSLCVLHIYPPDSIELYDRSIKASADLNLRPFPDYRMG